MAARDRIHQVATWRGIPSSTVDHAHNFLRTRTGNIVRNRFQDRSDEFVGSIYDRSEIDLRLISQHLKSIWGQSEIDLKSIWNRFMIGFKTDDWEENLGTSGALVHFIIKNPTSLPPGRCV
jgi:hypothetical protein